MSPHRPLPSLPSPPRRLLALGLCLTLLAAAGLGCRQRRDALPDPQRRVEQQRSARLCRQRRQDLQLRLEDLRRTEAELLGLRGATPPPGPPPPRWNEEEEQRYRPEDQEFDRLSHERELAAWRESETLRRSAWRARHAERLDALQVRLDGVAAGLRRQYPDLFTGPTSIEVRPAVLARLSDCPAQPG